MRFITTAISRKASIAPEVKGVDNVFLASHWLRYPGGLPMAAFSGKTAVELITNKEEAPALPFIGGLAEKFADRNESEDNK